MRDLRREMLRRLTRQPCRASILFAEMGLADNQGRRVLASLYDDGLVEVALDWTLRVRGVTDQRRVTLVSADNPK